MRLLITVPWRERLGGAETMLWNILRSLDRSRFEVTVAFLEAGPFEREVAEQLDVSTIVVPVGRLRQLRPGSQGVRELAQLMRQESPDLIVNWAAKAHIYAACAAQLSGCADRLIWWQHAIPSGHWMERIATLLPARAIGCSSTAAADAQAAMRPKRATFVVHPGVDADPVPPMDRSSLGIPAGRVVTGIVGRLQPWKGQHLYLLALAELCNRGHDLHGLVVGGDAHGLSPDYEPYLRRLIADLQLNDRVTMTGQVPDPRRYIASMDVLVNASVAEPFGIVLVEAMSQGVAVVAVGDGGAREIVENDVSGVLIPRSDELLLADAIAGLLRDDQRRTRIAEAGRERFLECFTTASMAKQLEERLETLPGHGLVLQPLAA